MELNSATEAIIKNLRPRFIATIEREIPALRAGFNHLQNDVLAPDRLEEVRGIVHNLSGAGRTYDCADITTFGRALEESFKRLEQSKPRLKGRMRLAALQDYEAFLNVCEETTAGLILS